MLAPCEFFLLDMSEILQDDLLVLAPCELLTVDMSEILQEDLGLIASGL